MESSENLNISKEEDPGVLERVYDISTDYVKDVVNDGLDLIVPEDNEETEEEIKEKLQIMGDVVQNVANDPEVHELIEDTGDAFANLTDDLVEAIEEPVEKIANKSMTMAIKLAMDTGKTFILSATDAMMSILAEIPWFVLTSTSPWFLVIPEVALIVGK